MRHTITLCDVCRSVPARTYAILALGDREGRYAADLCGPMCLMHWAARVWDGRAMPRADHQEPLQHAPLPAEATISSPPVS
jgi:hypothetical protein